MSRESKTAGKKASVREDANIDAFLRPNTWQDYVGQDKIKNHLKIIIEATRQRNEACDHLLFYGQAGLGKTTLAYLVAKELNSNIKTAAGPSLEKVGDLAAILSNLEPKEILFIDEAHRLNKAVEEVLYPAMESRKLHLIIGKGPAARAISLDLPPFTLIAATTRVDLLSSPLRSRFGGIFKLDYYNPEDIKKIIARSAKILGVSLEEPALETLAKASRFTPRTTNRLLKRCRDYAQVHKCPSVNSEVVAKTLDMLEVDELGLELADRRLIQTIITKFNGGPVGVRALAASLGEEVGTIEEVYEPFLLTLGFINRTPSGRVTTPEAYRYFGIEPKSRLL